MPLHRPIPARVRWLALLILALSASFSAQAAQEPARGRSPLPDGGALPYLVVAPPASDLTQLRQAGLRPGLLLVFGAGPGTEATVRHELERLYGAAAGAGWLVVGVPVRDQLFFAGGETDLPALLDHLATAADYDPERVVVAGSSNGGTGAIHVAAAYPERIAGLAATPGHVGRNRRQALAALAGRPAFLRYGEFDDEGWKRSVTQSAALLERAGATVDLAEVAGEGHLVDVPSEVFLAWLTGSFPARSPAEADAEAD